MPSALCQNLYLGGLPQGLNMTITDVKASVPSDAKWGVHFQCSGNGTIYIYDSGPHDSLSGEYPITVVTSTKNGLIGEVRFSGYNAFYNSGTGGKVDIAIRIQGTAVNVDGNSYTVDQKGYISISATEWQGFMKRPDYSIISYYWGDMPPAVLSLSVPATISGMPSDVYFVFAVSADGKQIGVTTTLHKEILSEVTDALIKGVFFAHEKMAGWVVGKVF